MEQIKIKTLYIIIVGIVLLLAGSFFVSGIYGFKVVLILASFALPFYFILDSFDFNQGEKIVFSIFLSLAFFSFFVYWINQFVYSYKLSLMLTYIILISAAIATKIFHKKLKKVIK